MVSQTIDWTAQYNAASKLNIDISGWEYLVVQFESPTGAINFNCTSDGGAVQGVTDGNATLATGWQPVQLINIATNTGATSSAISGNFKLNVGARFFQLDGVTGTRTVSRLLVFYSKKV